MLLMLLIVLLAARGLRMRAEDPACKRFMKRLCVCGTTEVAGRQWVRIELLGMSFMMHQIRKMVSMALAVFRNEAPIEALQVTCGGQLSASYGLWLLFM